MNNFFKHLEKPYVIIPLLLIVAFGVFFVNVSKMEDKKEGTEKTEAVSEKKESSETKTTETAFNGEEFYKNTCIGCHGDQYQGVVGPTLKGLSDKYSQEDVEKILKDGKGSGMPAGLVPEEHIKDMAKFLVELK